MPRKPPPKSKIEKLYGKQNESPPPRTSAPVKAALGKGLKSPASLTKAEVQAIAASGERHIEPRRVLKKSPTKPKSR